MRIRLWTRALLLAVAELRLDIARTNYTHAIDVSRRYRMSSDLQAHVNECRTRLEQAEANYLHAQQVYHESR
jgi:hypothetical protein